MKFTLDWLKEHLDTDATATEIADALNITRAELHGVISFYQDFREAPAGRHVVKIGRAEACQAVGADRLAAELDHAGTPHAAVYCLGNCALGPAALIGEQLIGRATPDRLAAVQAEVRQDD